MNLISLDIRMLRSLISVVDTGSITETARRLGRTQPAITLQLQRLEELTGKQLFLHEGRRLTLTADGGTVLTYAKSILRLHDELISQLASQEIEGQVVLGTPDLYAAYLLPSTWAMFRQSFPRIQVELRCSLSTPLVALVHRGEVDIALVTRMKGFSGGEVVGAEQLIWMVGVKAGRDIHLTEPPVPLALLPPGNIYRDHAREGWNAGRRQVAHRLRQREHRRTAGGGVRGHGGDCPGQECPHPGNAADRRRVRLDPPLPRSTFCSPDRRPGPEFPGRHGPARRLGRAT